MTIRNTNLKSREAFLSAFAAKVRDESNWSPDRKRGFPDSLLFGIVPGPCLFYGRLTEKGIRVRRMSHLTRFSPRIFIGAVEEDENGVVIRGAFHFSWYDKLCFLMIPLFSLAANRTFPAWLFGTVFLCAAAYGITWLTNRPNERDVKAFLSDLV